MKKCFLLVSLIMISASFSHAEEVVKTCKFVVKMPGETAEIPTIYEIVKDGNVLSAKATQTMDGQSAELPVEAVTLSEFDVRANVDSTTPDMNQAEELIVGTEEFLANPDIGSSFSVGLDLKAIRHAKVYQVGEFGNMGGTAIIEAKDGTGKDLGSFVTGFMPFACTP
jgi:hypothetical protein